MWLLVRDKARREAERQVKTKSRERLLTESWSYREPCTEEQLGSYRHINYSCAVKKNIFMPTCKKLSVALMLP